MPTVKTCPWCAEEILAEAKKCKHCGEFLTEERPASVQSADETQNDAIVADGAIDDILNEESEDLAPTSKASDGELDLIPDDGQSFDPVWLFSKRQWRCIAHGNLICVSCRKLAKPPRRGEDGQVFPERLPALHGSASGDGLPASSGEAVRTCSVGPCQANRVDGSSYCGKHGPRKGYSPSNQVAKYERTHVTAGEGSWWNGVEYAKVENVFTSGKKGDGTLKVTDEGLSWSAGLSKKKIPFEEIVQLGAEETSSQRGKQRSAFGFGLIGVAFVAATAISNHNARKVDTVSTLQVLTRDNEITTFSTKESFEPFASFFVAYRNSPLAAQEVADE